VPVLNFLHLRVCVQTHFSAKKALSVGGGGGVMGKPAVVFVKILVFNKMLKGVMLFNRTKSKS
jgi:hypothetical protein